jgi:UDP-3-O-[3-hydroxymyristoyl] glucosamine N-acyltransferase
MGGQSGAGGHITIGKGTKAGGRAGITSDIAPGSFINGNPAMPYMLERRIAVLQPRIPELFKRVDALEAQLADAKKSSS